MTNKPKKILFIDDDKIDRMAFERFASSAEFPYDFNTADSIAKAKELIQTERFDVVLIDFQLGDGTAFDIFPLLGDIPFIVVTGTGNQQIAVEAMKAGAYDYIIKDIDGKHFQTIPMTVENAINRKEAETELKKYREHLEELVQKRTSELNKEIEQRKQAQDELMKAKEKAEESDHLKSAFLANMSHEIRTPMNSILGFADLLKEPDLTKKEMKEYITIINNKSRLLLTLINDIIDISKIEANQLYIKDITIALNATIDELVKIQKAYNIKNAKKDLEFKIIKGLEDDECLIYADDTRLRQVITNLLNNAFKFTEKGFIELGYKSEKNAQLLFWVKDTGIGVPNEKKKIIFERFRQAEDGFTREYGGAGLGLAISRRLIELMGGEIWVESNKGKGSIFYFTLPYKQAKEIKKTIIEAKKDKKQYNWKGKQILIVEDDQSSFRLLQTLVKRNKGHIIHAKDGDKAIETCKINKDIDLVLIDIQLPGTDGYQITNEIKKLNSQLPIIAQTAHAMEEDKERSLQAGCDDYISKPINSTELLEKMDSFLRKT